MKAFQDAGGGLLPGDSHQHGEDIRPCHDAGIDDLILRELRRILTLPDRTVARRWTGVCLKHPTAMARRCRPAEGVDILAGLGGVGMMPSVGLAEQTLGAAEDFPEDPESETDP